MRMIKIAILAIIALLMSACGDDKTASAPATESTTMSESAMAETSSDSMASEEEYGLTIDHAADVAEFELRRSIGGLERMIEQYTADGYATDELEAEKAELSAKLNTVMEGA